ncbi:dTDP-4-dehydrorhamnose reductase family protein [Rhizobium ruizarguesonis]|jgi:dTDP-4-dehydrorhamnose reductase|uniref:dTDP-4-dehydrorhamnose reductase family protein n=1 Tax=Rhizobium ruizarguesonis TaxID=2081791 RepID=UPI001030BB2E|nr:SDR family oxidoreductase [Rhizobium ruizarguesonis]TAU25148.1 SDR family oxidoreductase [Rhizobium ruizarguesonis]TAU66791.1 SDR family oxidoreductase [Rhizobium ruizarguesonis]TAW08542.1 SDR family oxidoreductase [Rhizobium ruizarguesonis]TAY77926.1 SDR family oxidoreductase [Rhizobium ruizarguesonis]TAZ33433.1 SDR family oxidoreductase [Rhizobium ruizarguesonis]
MKIVVLGVSGMLGNAMFRKLSETQSLAVYGTSRATSAKSYFRSELSDRIVSGIDVENQDSLARILEEIRPDAVINCVGLIKQLSDANDPLAALPINAMMPHRLARLCRLVGARLVHISTDCVFSGSHGNYRESDFPDAKDLYGRSKFLGEVDYPNAITLRTSIIGHELGSAHSLIGWFLAQSGSVKGYSRAIFSGLPTVEIAKLVRDVVLPRSDLSGLYHVAATPISKLDLLRLVANTYGKTIEIVPDEGLVIDRSLNADRFREATGYVAPSWPNLIDSMHAFQ